MIADYGGLRLSQRIFRRETEASCNGYGIGFERGIGHSRIPAVVLVFQGGWWEWVAVPGASRSNVSGLRWQELQRTGEYGYADADSAC